MSDGADPTGHLDHPPSDPPRSDSLRIVRPEPSSDEPKTGIIRRQPTGAIPSAAASEPPTSYIEPASMEPTGYIPRPKSVAIPATTHRADPKTAVATAVAGILSGWATAVIATDLIAGWWRTDQLFCVAIGFLTAISAAATIGGLILILLRRRMGRLLVVVGAIIGLLIFASLFIAGAKVAVAVYAIPALPLASMVLAMLPATGRWARSG